MASLGPPSPPHSPRRLHYLRYRRYHHLLRFRGVVPKGAPTIIALRSIPRSNSTFPITRLLACADADGALAGVRQAVDFLGTATVIENTSGEQGFGNSFASRAPAPQPYSAASLLIWRGAESGELKQITS